MNKLKVVLLSVFLVSFMFINYSIASGQLFFFGNPMIGKKAENFKLMSISKKEFTLDELVGSRGAMIFFWATWCPHCRNQISVLNESKQAIESNGVKIIVIDSGENAAKVEKYLNKNGITMDVLLDQDSYVTSKYKVVGFPTFFFVNKNGIIKAVEHIIPENYLEIISSN